MMLTHLLVQGLHLSGIQGLVKDAELGQPAFQGAVSVCGVAEPGAENQGSIQKHGIAAIHRVLRSIIVCMRTSQQVVLRAVFSGYGTYMRQ